MSIITIIRCDNCTASLEMQDTTSKYDIGFTVAGMNPDLSPRHLCDGCYAAVLAERIKRLTQLAQA